MKRNIIRLLSLVLTFSIFFGAVSLRIGAASASEIRQNISGLESESKKLESEIKSLQGKINEQQKLKEAIEKKIAVVQREINACNAEISKINAKIAANKTEIDKNNKQIEADKLSFKKRLRAIYMSNTESNVQVLLGADDFASFLQLSQMVASVSARDKKLIENLVEAIKKLEEKQKENDKLLNEQVEIKKIATEKQNELMADNRSIQSVINSINSEQSGLENDNAKIEKQIKEYQRTLASMASAGGTSFVYTGGTFLWPVSGYYNITAGFQSNDSVHKGHHDGIDISGGGISGKPILAIADGVVIQSNNSCPHNYGKGYDGCGGGFGNYVRINHGTKDGNTYVAVYGHMATTAVSTGATVKKGQVIGYVGSTGWSTGFHLHLGIAVNGTYVNPMRFYSKS